MSEKPAVGSIGWIDLTVSDATGVRDFYKKVVGWETSDISMGDYDDYCVHPPEQEQPVAGICHSRGENASQPNCWLIYIVVADLDVSVEAVKTNGGEIVLPPRDLAGGRFAVIRDPAGAISGLYQA